MTERERLIELIYKYTENLSARDLHKADFDEKIADYLLENGVVVLPCKVGDTVYYITAWDEYADQHDHEQEVTEIIIKKEGTFFRLSNLTTLNLKDYGKWWYTDKEQWLKAKKIYRQYQREAEKALRKENEAEE